MARAVSSLWAEVDEARLVGVEGKSIPTEALAEDRQHARWPQLLPGAGNTAIGRFATSIAACPL
jgi:hypothetical protein